MDLYDGSRVDNYNNNRIEVLSTFGGFFFFCVECLRCKENQDSPNYKGRYIWSRNVSQHYKSCPFGCSSKEGNDGIIDETFECILRLQTL